jgi:hypothetical protein
MVLVLSLVLFIFYTIVITAMLGRHVTINRALFELFPAKETPVSSTSRHGTRDMIASADLFRHCSTAWAFLDFLACRVLAIIASPVLQLSWRTGGTYSLNVPLRVATLPAPC